MLQYTSDTFLLSAELFSASVQEYYSDCYTALGSWSSGSQKNDYRVRSRGGLEALDTSFALYGMFPDRV